jgi:hypothetical protein
MKLRILCFATLVFWSSAFVIFATELQAQTPAEKLQSLSQVLHLSPQQETQLLPILKAEAPKLEAIKNNPSIPPLQKAQELRAIHQQSDPEVRSILSPQQYQMWQQIRQNEIEQAMQHR